MSTPLSHFVPASPSPSLCPQVHCLHLCLYSCPAPRFFRTFFFFRFHIYVLAYGVCFSLSDLLHSVGQSLGPSTSLQITQFRSILKPTAAPLALGFGPEEAVGMVAATKALPDQRCLVMPLGCCPRRMLLPVAAALNRPAWSPAT